MEPISIGALVIGIVSAVGTVVLGILQILRGGLNCAASQCCAFSKTSTSTSNDSHDTTYNSK